MVFTETPDFVFDKFKNCHKVIASTPLKDKETETETVDESQLFNIFYKSLLISVKSNGKGLTVLGKGSFGRVVLTNVCGKSFAVKICSGSSCQCIGERNGLTLKHDNISRIYHIFDINYINLDMDVIDYISSVGLPLDIFKRFGAQIVVMEFNGRQTLQQLLDDSEQEVSAERRNHLIKQIACAISYCHDLKVCHLDIKPANIMVIGGDVCKLVDFGSSKRLDLDHECQQTFTIGKRTPIGTVIYCAPEMFSNKLVTPKADIYSFGITMWQMITRTIPFNNCEAHSIIYRVVSGKLRPSLHILKGESDLKYIDLMVNCWAHEQHMRPNSTELCQKLA